MVIIALSVGGFASMRHDLEIPARYGIRQPVGDSVGPGGICRAPCAAYRSSLTWPGRWSATAPRHSW